ncbi:hypothetical protein MLD38_034397 [Melastoma candidum]|uniref:Uncharacterized protein n=1 Tax=Melastoma candidum TaxID=119954 RepID=A0ACB9M9S7_9MYRT|nr:hypothetical protein MLD38_034397 [Melastoma candidum]
MLAYGIPSGAWASNLVQAKCLVDGEILRPQALNLVVSLSPCRKKIFCGRCPRKSFVVLCQNQAYKSNPQVIREWMEYGEAIKRKDLAKALRFLKSTPSVVYPPKGQDLGLSERDWEVLDACVGADDMTLVTRAYYLLKDRGFLPNFGKYSSIVLEGPRNVTPTVLKSYTGFEADKFAPKKWGMTVTSGAVLVGFLGGVSFLLSQGIDIRTNLAVVLGLAFADSVFLGGSCLAQISSYWPPHRRRILVHEAGHLLAAYLLGCPVRGVILDPILAMQMGIQGQAGTQFWDAKMDKELAEGRLEGTSFDRYSMVLFAGIAAETLVYGEAEGGENDENLFRSLCILLEPPPSVAEMANQARWSVLQSYNLLKWHRDAHRAVVRALESGSCLSMVIRRLEEAMASTKASE